MLDSLLRSLDQLLAIPDLWKYVSIPFVAAIVGWATNWVAIKMTFLPLEPVGKPPFLGWQGIIPSKAQKMSATFVDSTMARLGSLPEVFQEMDPGAISEHIKRSLKPRIRELTDEVMLRDNAVLWENLPQLMRQQIYGQVDRSLPDLVDQLLQDISHRVEELVDLKHMITTRLVGDKALLNRLFIESGEKEFRFIVRSGFYFGFLFGLVQLAVWVLYPAWWVLPVFGLLVGWATNWIALNVIFRPLHPKKMGPWRLQGLFLKRQREVSAVWCGIVTQEIFTIRQLVHEMLYGPRSHKSRNLVRQHIKPVVDEAVWAMRPVAQFAVGPRGFAEIKETVGEVAVDVSPVPFDNHLFNRDRAQVIERFLRQRMQSMPPDQFQDLLRPCFQEDETKLILIGAALGFLAGLAQLILVFGGVG
ncbi:MAG: hypothetical protein SX243_18340 [Acidobacteriota bacterium]|nr:hypothetical protein [Acidobacteriota bacterium]